jgi:hypothetical protein
MIMGEGKNTTHGNTSLDHQRLDDHIPGMNQEHRSHEPPGLC